MQADALRRSNPLPVSIDSRKCHHCVHDRTRGGLHIINPLDESLERGTQITPSHCEKIQSVDVPINIRTVCEAILLCDGGGAAPSDELRFNFESFQMTAN